MTAWMACKPSDGEELATPPAPAPAPVAWYAERDENGLSIDALEDPAQACRAGAEILGTVGGFAVCLDAEVHGVVWILANMAGESWPSALASESEVCPEAWAYVGGGGDNANCVRGTPAASARIGIAADGRTVDDVADRGDLCPTGWEAVGWPDMETVTCVHPDGGPVANLLYDADGLAFDDLEEPEEICPPGWEYVGSAPRYVGSTQRSGVCHATAGTTVTLGASSDGNPVGEFADMAEICPEAWSLIGMVARNAVQCATDLAISTAYLESTPDGTFYDGDPATAQQICPAGWDVLGFIGPYVYCGG